MFILTNLSIRWYIFSSNTGYSFGLIFIFLATFLICFLFIAAFTFLCFITASFLIFSFSFWSASFFAFSCSILFIILKFSSEVIQKLWNFFFLIVCFLMNVGTCIKSSKEKLLPGAVPSSLPPSSAAFPSASPHLSTETMGKSFRSIFKRNRCYNTSRLDLESTLPLLCLV